MSQRNYDFVTAETEGSLSYRIRVRPRVDTPTAWQSEVLEVLGCIFEAVDGLLTVTEANLYLQSVSDQSSLDEGSLLSQFDVRDCEEIHLKEDDGLTIDHVERVCRSAENALPVVPIKFEMVDGFVDLYLAQGMVSIDGECRWYKEHDGSVIRDEIPDGTPLTLSFNHGFDTDVSTTIERYHPSSDDQGGVVYDVDLRTRTDLWFYDAAEDEGLAAIARINKARFNEAFSVIESRVDLLETFWVSVEFPREPSRYGEPLTYDGPPAADLLRSFRREWVATHLWPQAAGETIDDTKTVSFGQVEQNVFKDELKLRIETYLFESGDHDVVDRVRVTTADGETLVGEVRDETVDWEE